MRYYDELTTMQPVLFDVSMPAEAPVVYPAAHFPLDAAFAGAWLVAGDLDGDGEAEFVCARNVDCDDVHFTSAMAAHKLDGSVLWRWGDPTIGRSKLHHDVACQIYDWDGDGANEVIALGERDLVALDGLTGREKRRFPIPPQASDCLVFADLSGQGRATDVLVKTRYGAIWAFTEAGRLLWTVENPSGYATAHQPLPLDIDGDGRDEVLAGYALLNSDGTVRWTLGEEGIGRGHLDCARSVSPDNPIGEDLICTLCGDRKILRVSATGQVRWGREGLHYESVDIGCLYPDRAEREIVVDVDHTVWGDSPVLVLDAADGVLLGRFRTPYSRFHRLVDWQGVGYDQIVLGEARVLCDGLGRALACFDAELPAVRARQLVGDGMLEYLCATGNILGGGDVIYYTNPGSDVWVFHNPERAAAPAPTVGFPPNYTLY